MTILQREPTTDDTEAARIYGQRLEAIALAKNARSEGADFAAFLARTGRLSALSKADCESIWEVTA